MFIIIKPPISLNFIGIGYYVEIINIKHIATALYLLSYKDIVYRVVYDLLLGGITMFQKTDFWIGLAVGAVAGVFGYRFMQEREQQMNAIQAAPAGQVPLAELQRQKEELEDLIAAQEAAKAE